MQSTRHFDFKWSKLHLQFLQAAPNNINININNINNINVISFAHAEPNFAERRTMLRLTAIM